jgi:hypothetical protein
MRFSWSLLLCLLLAPAGRLWAQPPPAEAAAPTLTVPGLGPVTALPDLAQGDCAFVGKLEDTAGAALTLTVIFDYDPASGNHYELRLTPQQAQFYLIQGGKATPLGEAATPPPLPVAGTTTDLYVRHDGWRLAFLLNSRLVCTAYDPALTAGNVGYALTGGNLTHVVLQSVGDIAFSDDFMRAVTADSPWTPLGGTWKETSLRIDPQADTMQEDYSANSFSYEAHGQGDARAISTAGLWFWADYHLEASVRPLGTGACGLIISFHDPDNYVAVRWTSYASAADGNRLELIERVGGQERVLAQTPGGFRPQQWYKLSLGLSDGCLSVSLDDEQRLSGHTTALLQGKCGLFVEGADGADFDDVVLEPWGYFADDFSAPRRWDTAAGSWQRGDHRLTVSGAAPSLLLGMPCAWSHYTYSADCHLDQGQGGVVFGATAPNAYYLMRYTAGDTPTAELVQVAGGQEKVLATAPAPQPVGQALRLGVTVDRNLVTGLVGDRAVLYAATDAAPVGRLGLYAHAAGAWFAYVQAESLEPPAPAHVTKEFRNDQEHWEMAKWATTRAPWQIPPELTTDREGNLILKDVAGPSDFGQSVWWSKGDFFGDKSVQFAITCVGTATGTLKVTLDAQPDAARNPVGGYTLTLTSTTGSPNLGLALSHATDSLGQAQVPVPDHKCQVEFARSGRYLQVWVGKTLALQAEVSPQ